MVPKYDPIDSLVDSDVPIEYQHHLKFLWHRDRVLQFLGGKGNEIHPVTAEIVPSLECNYGCKHCTYANWKESTVTSRGSRLMTEDAMYQVVEGLYEFGVRGVTFTGGGEPLFNRATPEGIRFANETGLDVGVFTNGSMLTPDSIGTVVSNSRFMRVSLNAITEETYLAFHNITNPHLLERVKENIAYIASYVSGSPMTFGVGVIVNDINKDDLENVAIFISETIDRTGGRIDYVGIRPVINYKKRGSQISPEVTKAVRRAKPKVDRILEEAGSKAFWAMDYFEDAVKTERSGRKEYVCCLANPWAVSVAYDGGVYLCSENDGNPNFLLGNILTQGMEEIWESERRRSVIESIGDCTAPTCKLHRLNKILNDWNQQGFGGDTPITEDQLMVATETLDRITSNGEPGGKNHL